MPEQAPELWQTVDIPWPSKGLSDTGPYGKQEPETTPDCLNVLNLDARTNRMRGGTRPGLTRVIASLDNGNPIQCLHQADASTLTIASGPANQVIATSTTQSSAANPAPTDTPATSLAASTDFTGTGNGSLVVPGPSTGYHIITPATALTSATKSSALGSGNTYLGSCWRQNGHAVILSSVANSGGASTLSADLVSSLSATDTTIQVANGAIFRTPAGTALTNFVVQIDSELIRIASVSGNTLTVATSGRGFNSTGAAEHGQGAAVTLSASSPLTADCASGISAAATSLSVSSTAPLYPAVGSGKEFTVQCENELLRVTAISGTTLTATRGFGGTTGAAHRSNLPITLYGQSTLSTALGSGINDTDTTIVVSDASNFPASGTFCIDIESETIKIQSRSTNTLTVAVGGRGFNSTSAAAHAAGVTVTSSSTTLNAALYSGITTAATTFTVASTTTFPFGSASYKVAVGDEICSVGSGGLNATTKTFTVTRAGSPSRHAFGEEVRPYASTVTTAIIQSGLTAATTTAPLVASLTPFPTSGTFAILIDSEVIKTSRASSTTLGTMTRAQNGTTAAAHDYGSSVQIWGESTLSSAISATVTSFTLSSSTQAGLFPSSGQFVVRIDSEYILFNSRSGTTLSGGSRGMAGGGAATTHAAGATVSLISAGNTISINRTTTTLKTIGNTTASVSSTAQFPSSGTFKVRVNSEVMNAFVSSGTVLSLARGTSNAGNTDPSTHASGSTIELDSATYGSTTLTTVGDTQMTVTNGNLLPQTLGSGVQMVVDGESVTATSYASTHVLNITRSVTPSTHESGGSVTLANAVSTTLAINASTSVVVASASTFPNTAPFTIKIDDEEMTVTGISGSTFTVTRGANGTAKADHSNSPAATVRLVGSVGTATLASTGDTSITVANAQVFPFAPDSGSVSSLSYPITVESETMTVTAINVSTNVLTVTRTIANGAATHTAGTPVAKGFSAASVVTNPGGITATVASASSFPSNSLVPFVIQVDAEQMQVTAVSGSNFTVTRGFNGTAVASHASGRPVTQVGAATSQQVQYEVRDQFGAAVKALTNLMVVTTGSQIYGMAAQEQPSGSNNFIWIWPGSVKSLSDSFSGFDPTAASNTGRECVLKYNISAAGTLSATTSVLSASTSGVIANKTSVNPVRMVNGTALAQYGPRHGGLAIIPSGGGSKVVLTETGSYVTASTSFVGTRIVSYSADTGGVLAEQLVALPSSTYSSGPVVGIPQQLVATGTRLTGANLLLSQFIDGPTTSDATKVTSIRATTFPSGTTAPAAVSTTVTGSGTQTHNLPEEVKLVESSVGATAEIFTSVAYNPFSNRALVVRRRKGDGSGHTAQTFAMSYTGTAVGGGALHSASPMGGISLEWCAAAPWGWIVSGVTANGTNDVVALNHDLGTLNTSGSALWNASVGYTASDAIKAPSVNFLRLADYTSGTVPATPTKGVRYSDDTLAFSERQSGTFTVKLEAQPLGNVTISLTSSDTNNATVSPSTLTFTALNWNSPQVVTVAGVAGSGTRTASITSTISSTADPIYNAIPTLPSVSVTITDADAAVLYGENRTSFTVKEGQSVILPVRLKAPPASNVVLTFTSSDTGQVTVSPTTLTFTSANYATDQTITMTGVADSADEGNISYTIAVTSASSDANYNGPTFNPDDLTVTVEDGRLNTTRVLSRLAVCGGKLFEVSRCKTTATTLFSRIGTATFSTSRVVRAANLGVRVFFADGDSQLEYNAAEGVLKTFTPRAGQFPVVSGKRPQGVEVWRERVFFFGVETDPQNWFCSRFQDPDDMNARNTQDTVNTPQDVNAAQKGSFAAAGLFPGGVLNGIIPYNFDISIWGGDYGLYQLAGDPGAGAVFDEITSAAGVGMAFGRAWCKDPLGQVYFFGRTGGVYRLRLNTPAQIMTDRITTFGVERMMSVDLNAYNPTLVWDQYLQGVHLFLTPYSSSGTAYWWFFDAASEGWFPMRMAGSATSAMHPLCAAIFDGDQANDRFVLTGGRDGIGRKIDSSATSDDGTSYSSYVVIGPFDQLPDYAVMNRLQADQTGFTLTVLSGETPSAALASSGRSLGTLSGNRSTRQRVRGRSLYVKASVSSGPASLDRITAEMGVSKN